MGMTVATKEEVITMMGYTEESFDEMGVEFEVMGLHWRGGENEFGTLKKFVVSLYYFFFLSTFVAKSDIT